MRRPAVRRLTLALAAGVLLFVGHPPVAFGPAGLVALLPLTALAADCRDHTLRLRSAFGWGLLAGVVALGPLLEWVARFGVLPWLLLVGLEAAFVGVFVALLASWRRPGFLAVAVLLWTAIEALRAAVPLGGFPWGLLGYTQQAGGVFLPAARSVGVLGVGALCAAVGVCLYGALAALRAAARSGGMAALGERGVRDARGAMLGLVAVLLGGVLLGVDPPTPLERTIDIAAVQGNDLPETAGLEQGRVLDIAGRVAGLTGELSDDPPDVVIWPENSLDDDVLSSPRLAEIVQPALESLDGTPVLAGMLTDGPGVGTFLNTVSRLEPGPRVSERYVKRRVVPFGEYVPGRRFLAWIPALDQIPRDAVPGEETVLFDVAGTRIGVVICFENIFPDLTRDFVREGAEVLVVSTNNASYGFDAASAQHLAFSRLRAVETGRWVLHAGISGISAVVDPHGRVSQETELFERAIVRAELPAVAGLTPAMRLGDALEWLVLAAAAVVLGVVVWDRRRGRA